jgi:hypothetical protein
MIIGVYFILKRIASTILGDGIIIGDNVVWYDGAGSLASVFCLNHVRIAEKKKLTNIVTSQKVRGRIY